MVMSEGYDARIGERLVFLMMTSFRRMTSPKYETGLVTIAENGTNKQNAKTYSRKVAKDAKKIFEY
jgi:hypothetical protein